MSFFFLKTIVQTFKKTEKNEPFETIFCRSKRNRVIECHIFSYKNRIMFLLLHSNVLIIYNVVYTYQL